jgi:hypothetical protein
MQIEVKMKIKTRRKVHEKTITVVIEKQHEFSTLELDLAEQSEWACKHNINAKNVIDQILEASNVR